MKKKMSFRAVIKDAGGGGAFVTVPFDVEETFGKKRVKVKAVIEGEPYRGSLVRMGSPRHILPVLKDLRARIGKGPGDVVQVTVEEDLEPREVKVPIDLAAALAAEPAARAFFRALSYSHKREYVSWIEDAKRPETRIRRIEKAVGMLGLQRKEL